MAKIPEQVIDPVAAAIDAHHERGQGHGRRPHLGASVAGNKCDRFIWLAFRWAFPVRFEGRMLRLFRRGHNEEATILADLRAIGCKIRETQARVDFGAHVSGSLDAIIESGVPGAEKTPHVAEFKTHGTKSFAKLQKDGVEKSKPDHYAQMQLYMHGTGIDRALYVAVCKDDDRIYSERVRYNRAFAERLVARAQRIALSDLMPTGISGDPTWYECQWCPARDLCHGSRLTREVHCRTCAHATATPESKWRCERWGADVPFDAQLRGCDSHTLHPDLVPWHRTDGPDEWTACYVVDGVETLNGDTGETSRNIVRRYDGTA